MQEELLKKLLRELDGIELTMDEARKLSWLAGWNPDLVECFCNLFRKCRESGKNEGR